ncbi:MAG: thiamine-phosphate kinase [Gammaproteobacteria bacterium]
MPVNEFELIEQVFRHLTEEDGSVLCGIGDDAAILRFPKDSDLVVTTDTLVNGVHFFADARAYDIGVKSLAVNLSDMAAMSAQPRWITLSLTLPETDMDWLDSFSGGFANMARRYNVSLVGGDITRGPLSITCQVMGTVADGGGIRRNGARPEDAVYVSGRLGLAAVALRRLQDSQGGDSVSIPEACLERLLRPIPRVELGMALAGTAAAMIDLSDGLAGDMGHILKASGAGAEIDLDSLPVSEEGAGFSSREIVQMAVAGGDDYELCFTVPAEKETLLPTIAAEAGCPLTRIGRIIDGSGIRWLDAAGNEVDLDVESYHHF